MSIEYGRNVEGIWHTVEVDGEGDADIEYTDSMCGTDHVSLDFRELERMYIAARAHRDAYRKYRERDYEGDDQYHRDFEDTVTALTVVLAD